MNITAVSLLTLLFIFPMSGAPRAQELMFAVVDVSGHLVRSMPPHEVSSQRFNYFSYKVFFKRTIENCARLATIGRDISNWHNTGGDPKNDTGGINTWIDDKDPTQVWVATRNAQGELRNAPFTLLIVCPPSK